jgi:hypothetical protein
VKRYLAAHGWVAIRQPSRRRRLDGLHEWLAEGFRRHRGSCDVVRQDLLRERAIKVSLPRWSVRSRRGAKRCGPRRGPACVSRDAAWQAAADRLWADHVPIGGTAVRVHLFVATLGYLRRPFVWAFRHER